MILRNFNDVENEEFLDKVILQSRAEHNEKIRKVTDDVNAYMEYAETLLRNYHKMITELKKINL